MADEIAAPAAAASSPSPAPAAASVAAASPAQASAVPAAQAETPKSADATIAPAAGDQASSSPGAPAAPAADAQKADDAAGAPAADAAKPEEGAAKPEGEAEKVAAPAAPEFKVPEYVKMDTATMSAYSNVLGKYNITPEAGQELLDFGANQIKAASDQMQQRQLDVWAETQQSWIADFDKTAGNRRDTILNDVKSFITDSIKDTKARKAFWNMLGATGAGNNKDVIFGLHAMAKRFREGKAPPAQEGVPMNGAARGGSAADRRYAPKA